MKNLYLCKTCGYISFNTKPESCPVCHSDASAFSENNAIFKESEEKSKEAAIKHIPAVTINKKCGLIPEMSCTDVVVRIGKTLHPMEEKHFIQHIDCYIDEKFVARTQLTPGVFAATAFHLKSSGSKVTIVENCNIHGYWQTEVSL